VHRHAPHHARLVAVVVDSVVLGGAVVPDGDVVLPPLPAHRILQTRDAVLQQFEQPCRFAARQASEALDEVPEQQGAFVGFRMHVHHRVRGLVDGCGKHVTVMQQARAVDLRAFGAVVVVVGVHGPELLGELLERVRQLRVGARGVGPHGVATVGGNRDPTQDGDLRKRIEEGHVGVPRIGAAAAF
jgi:hypothetical protein